MPLCPGGHAAAAEPGHAWQHSRAPPAPPGVAAPTLTRAARCRPAVAQPAESEGDSDADAGSQQGAAGSPASDAPGRGGRAPKGRRAAVLASDSEVGGGLLGCAELLCLWLWSCRGCSCCSCASCCCCCCIACHTPAAPPPPPAAGGGAAPRRGRGAASGGPPRPAPPGGRRHDGCLPRGSPPSAGGAAAREGGGAGRGASVRAQAISSRAHTPSDVGADRIDNKLSIPLWKQVDALVEMPKHW